MTCQHPVCLVSILAYMRYFFKSWIIDLFIEKEFIIIEAYLCLLSVLCTFVCMILMFVLQSSMMRVSPTRLDVQLKALETTNTALSSRMTSLEETVKMSNNLINEILIQLRQSRDEVKGLKVCVVKESWNGYKVELVKLYTQRRTPWPTFHTSILGSSGTYRFGVKC